MQLPSLSTVAISVLVAANAATLVQAKVKVLSWDDAYKKADALVSQMSLEQKVNITTGTGWMKSECVGNTYAITNPDFPSLCLEDAPLGKITFFQVYGMRYSCILQVCVLLTMLHPVYLVSMLPLLGTRR